MLKKDLIAKFQKLGFTDFEVSNLKKFLIAKEGYLNDRTHENMAMVKAFYMNIYMHIKHAYIERKINSETFNELIDLLQEDL